jgi:very-short-patch-repair endonuclease
MFLHAHAMRDIPAELLARPFTAPMAEAVGVTARQLRGSRCRQLLRGVYLGADVQATTEILAAAVALIVPPGAVIARTTAALLQGADIGYAGDRVIDVLTAREDQIRRPGIRSRAAHLDPDDVIEVMGIPVTSPVRTAFDLARRRDLIEAVVGVDAMLNRGGCDLAELAAYVDDHPGWRGVRWAKETLRHVEPKAESPMESRQRMRLVLGGLPRPEAQYTLYDVNGLFVARLDHGYEKWRVSPEYDGDPHKDRWRYDNERQQAIRDLGWWHRRYTSYSIGSGWGRMVAEVRAALLERGWQPSSDPRDLAGGDRFRRTNGR